MAVKSERIAVSTVAVPLNAAYPSDSVGGSSILIRPVGGAIDVGGSDVAAGAGFAVADGEAMEWQLDREEVVFAVAAAPVTVHVARQGV